MPVFVLDKCKKPLMPCSEKRVRLLIARGRAARQEGGTHVGRLVVRASGSLTIQTPGAVVQGISHNDGQLLQRDDGYRYSTIAYEERSAGGALSLPGQKARVSRAF